MQPTKNRGRKLVDNLRTQSKSFVSAFKNNENIEIILESEKAWNTLIELFNFLRNEQDNDRISSTLMSADTSKIIKNVDPVMLQSILLRKRIKKGENPTNCSLRDSLNK